MLREHVCGAALLMATLFPLVGVADPGMPAPVPRINIPDVIVAATPDPMTYDYDPVIAVDPENPNRIVAIVAHGHAEPGPPGHDFVWTWVTLAYASEDQGKTWSQMGDLPNWTGDSLDASMPTSLVYAPDGSVLYATLELRRRDYRSQLVFTSSLDHGRTWSAPVAVLAPGCTPQVTCPDTAGGQLATALDPRDSGWLYLLGQSGKDLLFARSADDGVTGGAPKRIELGSVIAQDRVARIAGGPGGQLLVALYEGSYQSDTQWIRTARSGDRGNTFGAWAQVFSRSGREYALLTLDAKIAPDGSAHIVFGAPEGESVGTGDIYHVWSRGPEYRLWSRPERVNDDPLGSHQLWPMLQIRACDGFSDLNVAWMDWRTNPHIRKLFYARKAAGGSRAWSRNVRVTDLYAVYEMYRPTSAMADGTLFVAWASYGDKSGIFGSRIAASSVCQPPSAVHGE